jgi:hypothetical protein
VALEMSAENARDAAEEILDSLIIPRLGDTDEIPNGSKFQLVTFATEADCRFFYPRRALNFHRQMNTYISRALRERFGIRVQRVALKPSDFYGRQEVREHFGEVPMSAEQSKRDFADDHLQLLIPLE